MDSVRVWIDAVSWEHIDKKILSLNSTLYGDTLEGYGSGGF